MAIQIETNLGGAREMLRRAQDLALHPRPLLEIAGGLLEESVRERFRTGTGPGGIPWPRSRRAQSGGRTLVDKGGLESSITHQTSDQMVEVGFIPKTESAKYAYVHQFGATIRPKSGPASISRNIGRDVRQGRTRKATGFLVFRGADGHLVFARSVTIPARPMLGIDANDRDDLTEAWKAYLESELGK